MTYKEYDKTADNLLFNTPISRYKILKRGEDFYLVDFSHGYLDMVLGIDVFLKKKAYLLENEMPYKFLGERFPKGLRRKGKFFYCLLQIIPLFGGLLTWGEKHGTLVDIARSLTAIILLTLVIYGLHYLNMEMKRKKLEKLLVCSEEFTFFKATLGTTEFGRRSHKFLSGFIVFISLIILTKNLSLLFFDYSYIGWIALLHFYSLLFALKNNSGGEDEYYKYGMEEVVFDDNAVLF